VQSQAKGDTRSVERFQGPLWLWPAFAGGTAALVASLLSVVRPESGVLARLWPSDTAAAGTLLQLVATAAVTITTLTFSITVVALQLAAQQYSPRLLRGFVQNPVIKMVLLVLTATFTYALAGLRTVHQDKPVPTLMVFGAAVLGVASFAAVLGFTTHMVRFLRIDTMMLRVHDDTERAMVQFYPDHDDLSVRSPDELALDADRGRRITADSSGYVRSVDTDEAVRRAAQSRLVVRVEVRPGDHVVRGAPIGTAWSEEGGDPGPDADGVVRDIVLLGYERTLDQDAAFGIRQLEDIAVKAMSPGINDPATANAAVGHMSDLLVRLTGHRLGATLHADAEGVGRVIVPDRDMRYYLDLACSQLRRFAASEPSVLVALLRMLREVARSCRDDEQRREVARAADLVLEQLGTGVIEPDAEQVREVHRRVGLALDGRVEEAYADRSGELRST
jgi:uncharacterized membrane protein